MRPFASWFPRRGASGRAALPGARGAATASDGAVGARLVLPYSRYLAGEEVEACFLAPPGEAPRAYEVEVRAAGGPARTERCVEPRWRRGGLAPGDYRLRVRAAPGRRGSAAPAGWSRPLAFSVHRAEDSAGVHDERAREHALSLMAECDADGVWTITDPWAYPPSCPRGEPVAWFRTPCYDGSGMLVNESPDYYRDPFGYYLDCIGELRARGADFVTWHDVLDGRCGRGRLEVLLQFDLDAGPRSMARLFPELRARGVRGTIMTHREAHDWYEWRIEDACLDLLLEAVRAGWAVGYHNNALGNVQRLERLGDYGPEALAEAAEGFARDVRTLRGWFDVRAFTHHGGLVLNKRTPVVPGLGIACVDRAFDPRTWERVRSRFSDGGFLARPGPLREHVGRLREGLHFLRNHPVKYGNYREPFDVPPLVLEDARTEGASPDRELAGRVERASQLQRVWLRARDAHRMSRRFSHASPEKPLSRHFGPFEEIAATVERFRARRSDTLLREYPWAPGDPRVFWWRMLRAFGPERGEVLNVGALPPAQRDENTEFLRPGVRVIEMDADPSREPDVTGDVVEAPADWDGRFACVLLLGLPYFAEPSRAVTACARLTSEGGCGLFGFAADTHPSRGGLWRPDDRPVWRRELEPLESPGLRSRLWSFGPGNLRELFTSWGRIDVEFFSHYWFVRAWLRP